MTGKIKVLIVDDHAILRMGLASLLASKCEIEVVGDASDGPSGIRKALKLKPDVVIMDLMMPGKNGIEAARDIRRLDVEDALTIPIIALTADVTENTDENCLQAGMNAALRKPVESEELFFTLAREFEKSVCQEQTGV